MDTINHKVTKSKKPKRITPHSLIEKRRRLKMNDCLSTLKSIVPSCSHHYGDLQKLTILEKTIEYVLELQKVLHDKESSIDNEDIQFNIQLVKYNLLPSINDDGDSDTMTLVNVSSPSSSTTSASDKMSIMSLVN
ncbi:hypothetical protein BC833DRAFT_621417 [Globomyces pollinis-pini]|nr:hypothetical protein BC833DRAFT_621417 [Globomyces pollinis-pini]